MRKLITEVHEESGATYQLWADLADVAVPAGHKTLTFSSVWTGAKDPKLEQKKCKFMFNNADLKKLVSLLEGND